MATCVPGAYDMEDYSAVIAFTRDPHSICVANLFKSSMQTKLSCSLVCKSWNAMIQSFLFQYLRIESGKQTCEIADALERVAQGAQTGKGPGKWTLRIDIALEGRRVWLPVHDRAMYSIHRECRNLTCFSPAFSNAGLDFGHVRRLITHLAENSNIKRLEIKSMHCVLFNVEEPFGDSLEVLCLTHETRPVNMAKSKNTYCLSKLRVVVIASWNHGWETNLTLLSLRACVVQEPCPVSLHFDAALIKQLSGCVTSEILRGLSVWSQLTAFSVGLFRLAFYDLASDESFKHSRLKYIIIKDFMEVLSMPAGWSTTNKGPDGLFVQMCENLMYIASRDTFPDKYSGDKEFWVNRFNTCNRRGIRIEVSKGAMKWVEDKWTEIPSMN